MDFVGWVERAIASEAHHSVKRWASASLKLGLDPPYKMQDPSGSSGRFTMFRALILSVPVALLVLSPIRADDWKPAPAPLTTRWAKDVSPDKVHPEYPRPQMVREKWQNLNGLWQFAAAKEGEQPPIGKNLHGQILVPFPVESALSGVGKHFDRLWYRRTFTIPAAWAGQRVLLHFGAVDWEAKVWVNGKPV